MKDKPEIITEWLISDDIEQLSYQLADLMIKSGYKVVETNNTLWNGQETIVWVLDEGVAFLRSYNQAEKLFFELSSFNHSKHLQFVILLKNFILHGTKGLIS